MIEAATWLGREWWERERGREVRSLVINLIQVPRSHYSYLRFLTRKTAAQGLLECTLDKIKLFKPRLERLERVSSKSHLMDLTFSSNE